MENKTKITAIAGIIALAAGLLTVPSLLIQESSAGTAIDTNILIGFDSWQDDILTDGKAIMIIRVVSARTSTLSGGQDETYIDKVSVDASKTNKFDERIVISIKAREAAKGRNATNITWNTQKQIYP